MKKRLISAFKGLLVVIMCVLLFFFGAAHASGHNIPLKTELTFLTYIALLILAYVALSFWGRRSGR